MSHPVKAGVRVAGAALAVSLLIAVLPQWYHIRETGHVVGCGTVFVPRNPPPPPPAPEDECDRVHVIRWIAVLSVLAAGIVGGAAVAFVVSRRRGNPAGVSGRPER